MSADLFGVQAQIRPQARLGGILRVHLRQSRNPGGCDADSEGPEDSGDSKSAQPDLSFGREVEFSAQAQGLRVLKLHFANASPAHIRIDRGQPTYGAQECDTGAPCNDAGSLVQWSCSDRVHLRTIKAVRVFSNSVA